MSNLQIKGIDAALHEQIKELAASENRSVSQQILYIAKRYIANKKHVQDAKMPAQVFLELSRSWVDRRSADDIVADIRNARKNSSRFQEGADVFT
jgi:superfamily I DNA/RNA helicase